MSKILITALLFALILTGCGGGKQAVTSYYLLEYPESLDTEPSLSELSGPIPFSCYIADVELNPAFASHQIAIREQANQINYFSFNEWAVRPSQSLTRLIVEFVQNHELCNTESDAQSIIDSDFIFETYVSRMDVTTEKNDFVANLAVEYKLLNTKTKQSVATHSFQSHQRLQDKSLNQFASAISEMFIEGLYAFAGKVVSQPQSD